MRQKLMPMIAVATLVSTGAFAEIRSNIDRVFNVAGPGHLVVDIDMGDVEVRGGGNGRIAVQVARSVSTSNRDKADDLINEFTYDVSQAGDVVSVKIDNKSNTWFNWGLGPQLSIKTIVTVPRTAIVEVKTSGGDVNIADTDGVVQAKTSGGDVDLTRLGGTIKASTSGGDVTVRALRSMADVSTSGGDILVEGAPAGVNARTSGGDIKIRGAAGVIVAKTSGGDVDLENVDGAVEARTSGGDVTARFVAPVRRDVLLTTSGGGVRLYVPQNSGFELEAISSGGDVSSNIPVAVQGKQSDDRLIGRVNGGGPKVRLRSSAGDIVIAGR